VEWAATQIEGVTAINVYKPPTSQLHADSIPAFGPPCIYAGDFNCRSTTWGYSTTNPDGTTLEDWASASGVQLLYYPKKREIRQQRLTIYILFCSHLRFKLAAVTGLDGTVVPVHDWVTGKAPGAMRISVWVPAERPI